MHSILMCHAARFMHHALRSECSEPMTVPRVTIHSRTHGRTEMGSSQCGNFTPQPARVRRTFQIKASRSRTQRSRAAFWTRTRTRSVRCGHMATAATETEVTVRHGGVHPAHHTFRLRASEPSHCVLLLDLPAWVTVAELFSFFGVHVERCLYVRMFQHGDMSCFYVRFSTVAEAVEFHHDLYGVPLSSFDPTECIIAFVDPVEDYEAPSPEQCAVCLQDIAGGSYTTLCNHRFHIACVAKLQSDSCPLCRFSPAAPSFCEQCGDTQGLWYVAHTARACARRLTHCACLHPQDVPGVRSRGVLALPGCARAEPLCGHPPCILLGAVHADGVGLLV